MDRATILSTKVFLSSGSFKSCIFWILNKLVTKNTKKGRVAATKDITHISVALVSESDVAGAIRKSAISIKIKVHPLLINDNISRNPSGLARTPEATAIAVARIAFVIPTVRPSSKAALAKMWDKAVSMLPTMRIGNAWEKPNELGPPSRLIDIIKAPATMGNIAVH